MSAPRPHSVYELVCECGSTIEIASASGEPCPRCGRVIRIERQDAQPSLVKD